MSPGPRNTAVATTPMPPHVLIHPEDLRQADGHGHLAERDGHLLALDLLHARARAELGHVHEVPDSRLPALLCLLLAALRDRRGFLLLRFGRGRRLRLRVLRLPLLLLLHRSGTHNGRYNAQTWKLAAKSDMYACMHVSIID